MIVNEKCRLLQEHPISLSNWCSHPLLLPRMNPVTAGAAQEADGTRVGRTADEAADADDTTAAALHLRVV